MVLVLHALCGREPFPFLRCFKRRARGGGGGHHGCLSICNHVLFVRGPLAIQSSSTPQSDGQTTDMDGYPVVTVCLLFVDLIAVITCGSNSGSQQSFLKRINTVT
jgi:hypothetical protein